MYACMHACMYVCMYKPLRFCMLIPKTLNPKKSEEQEGSKHFWVLLSLVLARQWAIYHCFSFFIIILLLVLIFAFWVTLRRSGIERLASGRTGGSGRWDTITGMNAVGTQREVIFCLDAAVYPAENVQEDDPHDQLFGDQKIKHHNNSNPRVKLPSHQKESPPLEQPCHLKVLIVHMVRSLWACAGPTAPSFRENPICRERRMPVRHCQGHQSKAHRS